MNGIGDEDYPTDNLIDPEDVRTEKPDFRNTLWRHINATRRVLSRCFHRGTSTKDVQIAENYIDILEALISGMADQDFQEQWEQLEEETEKYSYAEYATKNDIRKHHKLLIKKLKTIIHLLGRKGEFPEERVKMMAE